jgi:hypothetical protein
VVFDGTGQDEAKMTDKDTDEASCNLRPYKFLKRTGDYPADQRMDSTAQPSAE